MLVPFLDLRAQLDTIREDIDAALSRVLDQTAFAGGPFVADFEEQFADHCGTRYAIGVNSGTTALWIALLALGLEDGDEVITTPLTFIATAAAISFAGGRPVFIDIDEQSYTMDPEALSGAIGPRTKAIIPVHLYGQPADMGPIGEIALQHGIPVIEDAAQAHSATYRGQTAGSIGLAGCFSFYPGKNLGAYGEAGAITTDNEELAERARMLRDHGQAAKYSHELLGWNGRMDGFQAAVLKVKLKHIARWTEQRRDVAGFYTEELRNLPGLTVPQECEDRTHVYHLYVVRSPRRDELMRELRKEEVHCGLHYPTPVHLQPAYAHLGYKSGSFPVAERVAQEVLSMPMYPELSRAQQEHVVESVVRCLSSEALRV